jgi:hypothetical protein
MWLAAGMSVTTTMTMLAAAEISMLVVMIVIRGPRLGGAACAPQIMRGAMARSRKRRRREQEEGQ